MLAKRVHGNNYECAFTGVEIRIIKEALSKHYFELNKAKLEQMITKEMLEEILSQEVVTK